MIEDACFITGLAAVIAAVTLLTAPLWGLLVFGALLLAIGTRLGAR